MGSFSGMDVDEVEQLAARLDLQAKAVATVVGVVDAAVSGLSGIWSGDDLDSFRGVWHQTHRPRALSIGEQLSGWVTELRRQVTQQRGASGETRGSGGSLSGLFAGISDLGSLGFKLAQHFSGNEWSTGRYPRRWATFLGNLSSHGLRDDFFRYKTSPIFHFLNDNKKILGWADHTLGIAGVLSSSALGMDDLREHHFSAAADDAADAVGSVFYWGGAAARSWLEVLDASRGVDWSPQGLGETWRYMLSDPLGAVSAGATYDLEQMPGRIIRIFGIAG
jgi:hypothetical protein